MTAELATIDTAPVTLTDSAPQALIAWADAASAAHRLAAPLVSTDFVPAHFRPKGTSDEALRTAQASATAAILYGAEAGLSPLQALQGIYVIGGKPAMYARTLLAVTLAQGHDVWTEELTDSRAVVCGRRRGTQRVEKVTFTIDRARKAGYTKNAKYQMDPQAMLLARAQSDVCRRIAADALLGMPYSVEELEDEDSTDATATVTSPKRTAKRAPLAAAPEPEAAEAVEPDPTPDVDVDPRNVPATAEQVTKLNIQLQEAGITDRDAKLAYLSEQVGRDISSSKDLTKPEAHGLIDALEREQSEPTLDEPGWHNHDDTANPL